MFQSQYSAMLTVMTDKKNDSMTRIPSDKQVTKTRKSTLLF